MMNASFKAEQMVWITTACIFFISREIVGRRSKCYLNISRYQKKGKWSFLFVTAGKLFIIAILLLSFLEDKLVSLKLFSFPTFFQDPSNTFKPVHHCPSWAIFVQNFFIFLASLTCKFERSEDLWG